MEEEEERKREKKKERKKRKRKKEERKTNPQLQPARQNHATPRMKCMRSCHPARQESRCKRAKSKVHKEKQRIAVLRLASSAAAKQQQQQQQQQQHHRVGINVRSQGVLSVARPARSARRAALPRPACMHARMHAAASAMARRRHARRVPPGPRFSPCHSSGESSRHVGLSSSGGRVGGEWRAASSGRGCCRVQGPRAMPRHARAVHRTAPPRAAGGCGNKGCAREFFRFFCFLLFSSWIFGHGDGGQIRFAGIEFYRLALCNWG